MWSIKLLLLLYFQNSGAVIFSLNKSEFARMPPVYHLDKYEQCLYENDATGVYCHAKFDLFSDEPSDLYHMIQEYSARRETHLNHTQLSYGICLTRTCKDLYKNSTTEDPKTILEACLNETLWRDYKLKAKINHEFSCTTAHDESKIDTLDVIVAVLFLAILGFNLVESFREIYYGTDKCPEGNDFLSCFSISRNWAKLTAPSDGPDLRLSRLKFLQGSKCIVTFFVLMTHSAYPAFISGDNPQDLDRYYTRKLYQLLINGSVGMQTFFSIGGFLLAYNFEILTEKRRVSSAWIPLAIVQRWFKIFAPYAVVVAFAATWYRYLSSGPLWQSVVVSEVEACRNGWWKNLFFINNYIDVTSPPCLATSWYLATDLQLYILGVLLLVLTSGLLRKVLLGILVLTGLTATAAITYYQDLDGALLLTPEAGRNLMLQDRTYNLVYIRTHTNLSGYFMGVAAGLAVYYLSKGGVKIQRYPFMRYRYLGLLLFVSNFLPMWFNEIMYPEGPRPSLLQRTAYSVISKVLMTGGVSTTLITMVLLENDKCKDFLSWRGWAMPSRLAYSVYLVHFFIIKILAGSRTTLLVTSEFHMWQFKLGTLALIFVVAILFHLLVEAPFNQLMKMYMTKYDKKENGINKQLTEETIATERVIFKEQPDAKRNGNGAGRIIQTRVKGE